MHYSILFLYHGLRFFFFIYMSCLAFVFRGLFFMGPFQEALETHMCSLYVPIFFPLTRPLKGIEIP